MTATCTNTYASAPTEAQISAAAKAAWVVALLSSGHFTAAAVAANAFIHAMIGNSLDRAAVRRANFYALMAMSVVMITTIASSHSYLPLVAAWLAVSSYWTSGWKKAVTAGLGDVAWIFFGILVGNWFIAAFGVGSLAVTTYQLFRGSDASIHSLSPILR